MKRIKDIDEDQLLVKKILNGDKSSFEEFMHKYNKKIFNYIFYMVRNEEIAAELTQDLFIKLYTILHKYKSEYKFTTWMYKICYNMVIDYIRKNKNIIDSIERDFDERDNVFGSNAVDLEDACAHLEKEELKRIIWSLTENIPKKFKELIVMRYSLEMKYEEISELLDLPIGTVKNRIFRAKSILKEELLKNELFKQR